MKIKFPQIYFVGPLISLFELDELLLTKHKLIKCSSWWNFNNRDRLFDRWTTQPLANYEYFQQLRLIKR